MLPWAHADLRYSSTRSQYGSFHPGEGLGGSAAHWSAQLWRFLETDFKYRSHVIERYGQDKVEQLLTGMKPERLIQPPG